MMKEEFNKKLGAMILLLTNGKSIRRTSLNKLLFFADLSHFLNTGESISGSNYLRMQYGPVPEEIDVTRETLRLSNYLSEERKDISGSYHFLYTVNEDKVDLGAVASSLNQDELNVINAVKTKLSDKTATFLSEKSHEFEPWKGGTAGDVLDLSRARHDAKLIRWMRMNGMVKKDISIPETV